MALIAGFSPVKVNGTWLGLGGLALQLRVKKECSSGWNGLCRTAGRMRYSHERRLLVLGAEKFQLNWLNCRVSRGWLPVKAEPDSCSAYSPYAHFCGEFCPSGRASGHRGSSVANSLPNPLKYFLKKIIKGMYRAWRGMRNVRNSGDLHANRCQVVVYVTYVSTLIWLWKLRWIISEMTDIETRVNRTVFREMLCALVTVHLGG